MISMHYIQGRGFGICCGTMTPYDTLYHSNIGDGTFNQAFYIYSGEMTGNSKNKNPITLQLNKFTDTSDFFGQEVIYTTQEQPVFWFAINPIPETKRFDIQMLTAGEHSVVGDGKERTVVCIDRSIQCNEKILKPHQFTRVLNGKTVNIIIPERGVAALLTA